MLLNLPQIFTNFCFGFHNFGSRHTRKPFKGSKDAYFGLVFKKNSNQKIAQWVGAQGWVNLAKNAKTCLHCDVIEENLKSKAKNFF